VTNIATWPTRRRDFFLVFGHTVDAPVDLRDEPLERSEATKAMATIRTVLTASYRLGPTAVRRSSAVVEIDQPPDDEERRDDGDQHRQLGGPEE